MKQSSFRHLIKREQYFFLVGIFFIVLISWIYLFNLGSSMDYAKISDEMMTYQNIQWSIKDILSTAIMWIIMMIAMMLPSALPMIMIFSIYNKKQKSSGNDFVNTWIFVAGYVMVWICLGILASLLQFFLHNTSLLNQDLRLINHYISGVVLISSGIYQYTPLKGICLKNCQTPFGFIVTNWRKGKSGAFIMGAHHGLYCVGCCWALMLILLVAGIMNLLWIGLISVFIFVEKIFTSKWLTRVGGSMMLIWGIYSIIY